MSIFGNAHLGRANASLHYLIWHWRAEGERLGIFVSSAHLRRANARLGGVIWHSRAKGEHLGIFYKFSP